MENVCAKVFLFISTLTMFRNLLTVLLFTAIVFGTYQISYPSKTPPDLQYDGMRMEHTLGLIESIAKKPHPTGSINNNNVRHYLIKALKSIGGDVTLQDTISFDRQRKTAAPIKNIVAVFPASEDNNRPKLMLMSHYDSAKPFSKGAADAGSGVAVILEVLRNYLTSNPERLNDIVVLFTDGEELGLLGARAFVNSHHLSKDIGLVLNFEARGSSGPSIMWPETTAGNSELIRLYQNAAAPFPVTASLIYDIYRLLPNDTDLTVFNQSGGIPGYNLAFIDDHFNYHTAQDDPLHLSYNSLMHQKLQLHALLPQLANTDLSTLDSDEDLIYFTLPGAGLFVWPSWTVWLLIALTWVMAILTISRNKTHNKGIHLIQGSLAFAAIMVLSWAAVKLLMWLLYVLFKPGLQEILQGFPYLGHAYILVTWLMVTVLAVSLYGKYQSNNPIKTWPPVLAWSALFTYAAIELPGSSYLLLPAIIAWLYLLLQQKWSSIQSFGLLFAVIALMVLALLLTLLPVALGLKMVWLSALLLVWVVAMFSDMIAPQKFWQSVLLMALPMALFTWTINKDQFSDVLAMPTSLSYLYDHDSGDAWYYSMDRQLSDWNAHLFADPAGDMAKRSFYENHRQAVRHLQAIEHKQEILLPVAEVEEVVDRLSSNPHKKQIIYRGIQHTDQVHFRTMSDISIKKLSINGRYLVNGQALNVRAGERWLRYHLDGRKKLDIHIELSEGDVFDWQIQSFRFDLMQQQAANLPARPAWQMPKPFIMTDNVVVSQKFPAPLSPPEENQ